MQTFLPYSDFRKSAEVLDYKRLGKQRVEAYQILNVLLGISRGWQHHPAVKMWIGYEKSLVEYGLTMCYEWIKRGYKDNLHYNFETIYKEFPHPTPTYSPLWLGNSDLHISHQSNLLRKYPEYYSKFFPDVPNNLPYYWPKELINV